MSELAIFVDALEERRSHITNNNVVSHDVNLTLGELLHKLSGDQEKALAYKVAARTNRSPISIGRSFGYCKGEIEQGRLFSCAEVDEIIIAVHGLPLGEEVSS